MIKYFKKIKEKLELLDKMAQNPFLRKSYNPFETCRGETLIWIEKPLPNENGNFKRYY